MSPNFSDRAPQPKSYVGISLVVALHLAAIYALSAGLMKPMPKEREIATVKPLPPEVRDIPPPQEPLRAHQPTIRDVTPIPVPDPIDPVVQPDPVISTVPLRDPVSVSNGSTAGTGPVVAIPAARPETLISTPGAVCSVMPRPEVPAVNWSGEAVLQVVATVRGGRVVGSDFRVAQGALDGKTKRSLQRSVESALAGYQCQGDAMFQQDFAFRLD